MQNQLNMPQDSLRYYSCSSSPRSIVSQVIQAQHGALSSPAYKSAKQVLRVRDNTAICLPVISCCACAPELFSRKERTLVLLGFWHCVCIFLLALPALSALWPLSADRRWVAWKKPALSSRVGGLDTTPIIERRAGWCKLVLRQVNIVSDHFKSRQKGFVWEDRLLASFGTRRTPHARMNMVQVHISRTHNCCGTIFLATWMMSPRYNCEFVEDISLKMQLGRQNFELSGRQDD